jgi:hypothetical protein
MEEDPIEDLMDLDAPNQGEQADDRSATPDMTPPSPLKN